MLQNLKNRCQTVASMAATIVMCVLGSSNLLIAPALANDDNDIHYSNRASYPISVEPFLTAGIAIGDIDGDGDLDMIEANGRHWPQANYVYFNAGNRRLSSRYQLGELERTGYTVKLVDLDGDGDLDVVQASDKMENQVFFNDGSGQFGPAHLFGSVLSNTRSIEIADLNGDGALDILEICRGTPNLIFLNDGTGKFPASEDSNTLVPASFGNLSDRTLSVKVADMNNDGLVDLILANRDKQQNKILLNEGNMQFGSVIPFGSGTDDTRGLVAVDMNGDDLIDIVTANIGEPNNVILNMGTPNMEGEGFVITQNFGDKSGLSYAILAHDLDSDGDMDIIIGNVADVNRVYVNNGAGKLSLLAEIGEASDNTYALGLGDLNGDGRPDIIAGNSEAANIAYYQTAGAN